MTSTYPIWWGKAPHIVYSLVENVSLKKKTVIPFSTSISSGLGNSGKHLKTRAQITSKTKIKINEITLEKKIKAVGKEKRKIRA